MKDYTIGLYEKAMPADISWREKLKAAKDANYDFVELSIDATEDRIRRIYMTKEERLDLVKQLYELDMPIGTLNDSALTKYAIGSEDDATAARGMEILEGSISLAADLGARVVMIPGYDVYYDPSTPKTVARFTENLKKAVLMAESAGVTLGFETMENEFMNTVEKGMAYVNLCDSCYLQMYPDIGNMTNAAVMYHTDVLEDLEKGHGHLTGLHLKETKPGVFREVPYGEGHVDFEAAISKAWDLGIRRYVTEFWYLGDENWREELSSVNTRMRAILDQTVVDKTI